MLYMLLQLASSLCLILPFWCVWPLQSFLDGRNVFIIKPVFRSYMYGCTCARIFIQSAWSNLSHVKIKCLIDRCTLFLNCISWFCIITLEVLALLMMFLLMHQSISWAQDTVQVYTLVLFTAHATQVILCHHSTDNTCTTSISMLNQACDFS